MRGLQVTCLTLAIVTLCLQGVRHFYVKYLERTGSVLDRYEKKEIDREIEQADSLAVLVAKYEPVRKRTDELDAMLKTQVEAASENERESLRSEFHRTHEEEYSKKWKLGSAIRDWESKSRKIRELRIFWGFGLGLVILGCVLYIRFPWLAMAFLIPGVIEMIWWTSPSFRWGGTVQEYERLLNNRLVFTSLTLVLVIGLWAALRRLEGKRSRGNTLGDRARG